MQNLKSDQKVLIITGMHRSGTSLVASLLQSAGLHIGRRLMQATEFNPKGHFENLDFFEFHLDVLRSQGVNIDGWTLQETIEVPDEFIEKANQIVENNSVSQIWGWKEPRTTLLLDFWAELLPESKFLLIYRSPWEVIDSLYRRGDKIFQEQPDLAVKYWLFYNQKVLDFYNQHTDRCVLANLQTIVGHQTAYIEEINHQFKTGLSHPSPAIYDPSLIQRNLSKDGHRPSLIDHYFPEAIEMYQELEGRGWHPEKTPDLSWNAQIKSSPYAVWAFRDWANFRKVEAENKSLKAELEQSPSRDEIEQTQSQLQKAESLVEQFQAQLHETEEVLEKSQAQLQKTESILKDSHEQLGRTNSELNQARSQLTLTQQELEQAKSQLSQTQWDVMRYQSQLHSTQEELEQSDLQNKELVAHQNKLQSQLNQTESQILKSEMILSQLRLQLKQAQKTEARTIAQLHYTQGELEKSQSKQHQYLATLERLEPQLETTEIQLSQSMVKLNQSQKNQARLQVQLHQIQGELEQSQTQLHQTQVELEQSQTQLHQTRGELEQSQTQLDQTQGELEQSHGKQLKMQEELVRLRLERSLTDNGKTREEVEYQFLVWKGWNSYTMGQYEKMIGNLKQAWKLQNDSPSETILDWLGSFEKFSAENNMPFNSEMLTNLPEWKELMKRVMANKRFMEHKTSSENLLV